jgi:hypothetical protein
MLDRPTPWFLRRNFHQDQGEAAKELNIEPLTYRNILQTLAYHRYIKVDGEAIGVGFLYTIQPSMVEAARLISAKEKEERAPKDLVAQANAWARRHPVIAGLLIICACLGFIITVLNQLAQFLRNIGWWK